MPVEGEQAGRRRASSRRTSASGTAHAATLDATVRKLSRRGLVIGEVAAYLTSRAAETVAPTVAALRSHAADVAPVLLGAGNAAQLIMRVQLFRINVDSAMETLARLIQFTALLMNQTQIVMR